MAAQFPVDLSSVLSLANKTVVITNAANTFGREVAQVMASAGARLLLADRDMAAAERRAAEICASGGCASASGTDCAQHPLSEELMATALARLGRVDVWINCGHLLSAPSMLTTDEDSVQAFMEAKVLAFYRSMSVAARSMAVGGVILNIFSGGVFGAGMTLNAMAVAAVESLTKTAALELGALGIRVNGIAAGLIAGDETCAEDDVFWHRSLLLRSVASHSVLGRTGSAADVAYAALYLATDAARFVTGQILPVNGGQRL